MTSSSLRSKDFAVGLAIKNDGCVKMEGLVASRGSHGAEDWNGNHDTKPGGGGLRRFCASARRLELSGERRVSLSSLETLAVDSVLSR